MELNSTFKSVEFYTEEFSKIYPQGMGKKPKGKKAAPRPGWSIRMDEIMKDRNWTAPFLAGKMGERDNESLIQLLYKYRRGDVDKPRGEILTRIASAFGVDPMWFLHGDDRVARSARASDQLYPPTLGEVAANVFRDVTGADDSLDETDASPIPADPRFPADQQFDVIVRGTSINRVAPDGHRLRVLRAEGSADDGELVIVRRRRDNGQIVETTAKRLVVRGMKKELWPDSDDPRWQTPLALGEGDPETDSVEIIGKVLFAFQTTKARR